MVKLEDADIQPVLDILEDYEGTLLKTSLDVTGAARLREALSEATLPGDCAVAPVDAPADLDAPAEDAEDREAESAIDAAEDPGSEQPTQAAA